MKTNKDNIGYLKYSGKSVEDGLLDARKAGEALIGFDEILRYFIIAQSPSLKEIEFELPVRINKGSWEILITTAITNPMDTAIAIYGITNAFVAAKHGIREAALVKDGIWIVKSAISLAQIAIKTKKDTSSGKKYSLLNKNVNDIFEKCPQNIFSRNAKIVGEDISMEIGLHEDDGKVKKEVITEKDKDAFILPEIMEETPQEISPILPELVDGKHVILEGKIEQVAEEKNLIKFRYEECLIDCKPMSNKSLSKFKIGIISEKNNDIFQKKVKIEGKVERIDSTKKPSIWIISMIPLGDQKKFSW